MAEIPALVRQSIEGSLAAIAEEFRPGAKLTLLVRSELGPDKDGDFVITNDTLGEAIEALTRRQRLAGSEKQNG